MLRHRMLDAAFLAALAALAAWAAMPIYRTPFLWVTAGGALLLGLGVAALGTARRLNGWWVVLLAAAAYIVFGVPLAVPAALRSPQALLQGFLDLLAAPVLGWKQLVTVALPVGTYEALLAPFLFVLLGCVVAAASLAWRVPRAAGAAVPVMLLPLVFALAFGSSAVSAPVSFAGISVLAPRETAVGLAAVGVGGAFLIWRAQLARSLSLRQAMAVSGVRQRGASARGRARRIALGALVAAVAVVVAVPVSAVALGPASRDVIRTAADPAVELPRHASPLTEYRASFAGDAYSAPLLRVSGDLAAVGRLRLAVLTHYDGTAFQAVDPDAAGRASAYARVPQFPSPGSARLTITVDGYRGIWLPAAGGLASVAFTGPRADALTDGLFVDSDADAAVDLAGLRRGDVVTVTADPRPVVPLSSLRKPSTTDGLVPAALVPDSLVQWVDDQHQGQDAAGLAELIRALRARGYLSHSLAQPTGTPNWFGDSGEKTFEPSFAGESVARIGQLFSELIDQQKGQAGADADLVAAVGDDEQFAVAAALVAQHLGFPSRVVLGFALDPGATDADSLPACEAGVCTGGNLTAWVEVQGADGEWAAVDTTPQHTVPLAPTVTTARDPQNPTDVTPQGATEEQPPQANPQGSAQQPEPRDDTGLDLGWLLLAGRIAGGVLVVLLVLAAPFLAAAAMRAGRRRARRRSGSEAERIAAGWDELVDALVDRRMPLPPAATRAEVAGLVGSREASTLAVLADAAAFGDEDPRPGDAERFWQIVDEELDRLRRSRGFWSRLRDAVAIRSFRRALGRRP